MHIDTGGDQHMNCAHCNEELTIGVDIFGVTQGVVGTRGVVPLHEMELFCSERCLRESFDDSSIPKLPRQLP